MIVVSDTTPLRYLIELEAAEILSTLFGRVLLPERVCAELQDAATPDAVREWMQAPPAWIEVRAGDLSLFAPRAKIEDGEREAIALALMAKADALLCDDGKAIREAGRINLPVLRLGNLLELAAERNLLDLPETIARLRQTTFHLPPEDLINAMLARDRQRKGTELSSTPEENL